MECSDRKTASPHWMGTSGRNTPFEMSPSREAPPTACVVICTVSEFIISVTSRQDRCAAAIAEKSTACASVMAAKSGHSGAARPSFGQSSAMRVKEVGGVVGSCCAYAGGRRGASGRLKAYATTFSWPGVCLMSDVNSAMKDSCRCWRADQGGVVRNRDVTSGLWSVRRQSEVSDCAESGQQLPVEGGVSGACP
jgi:hypothetical protein